MFGLNRKKSESKPEPPRQIQVSRAAVIEAARKGAEEGMAKEIGRQVAPYFPDARIDVKAAVTFLGDDFTLGPIDGREVILS